MGVRLGGGGGGGGGGGDGMFFFLVLFLCLVIVAVVVVGNLSRLICSRLEDTTDATGVGESWDRVSCVSWVSSVSPVY